MSDLSPFISWLLFGGLVVVCLGFGGVLFALWNIRRCLTEQSEKMSAMLRFQVDFPSRLAKQSLSPDLSEIEGLLREEWQSFQAVYRAEMATAFAEAEARLTEPHIVPDEAPMPQDSLERAILMARAGRSAQNIMADCGISPFDAEALVQFHQPRRSLAS